MPGSGRRRQWTNGIEETVGKRACQQPQAERDVGEVRPQRGPVLLRERRVDGLHSGMVGGWLTLDHFPQLLLRTRDHRGIELVVRIPVRRIGLEGSNHGGQGRQQGMARRPAQQRAGAADVELIMVVGNLDHPGPDEGIVRKHLLLHPGARLDQRLGQRHYRPGLAMHELADAPLQGFVAGRLGFPEEKGDLSRQVAPPVHHALDRIDEIIKVQRRLAVRGVSGEQVAGGLALVDAGDLLGKKRGAAALVVDPGRPQDHDGDQTVLGSNQLFRLDLRLRVGPLGFERPVLGDRPSWLRGGVNEHRTRKHELLDFVEPTLQASQQTAGALHRHALVLGIGLAGEIVVRRQVNYRSEAGTKATA